MDLFCFNALGFSIPAGLEKTGYLVARQIQTRVTSAAHTFAKRSGHATVPETTCKKARVVVQGMIRKTSDTHTTTSTPTGAAEAEMLIRITNEALQSYVFAVLNVAQ